MRLRRIVGFGDELELTILAKMMLAEYYETDFFIKNCLIIWIQKENGEKFQKYLLILKKWSKKRIQWNQKERWYDLNKIGEWLITEPEITDKDLRPYYYACKEKN